MRHLRSTVILSALAPAALVPAAHADEAPAALGAARTSTSTSPYSFGGRIGGWGFHRSASAGADDRRNDWDECRMNGVGVFAERVLRGPAYLQVGLDAYFSETFPMRPPPESDLPINRVSGLLSVGAGLRTQLASRLTGHAELGVGVELTRVSVPYGDTHIDDQLAIPEAFVGLGGDVRVGRGLYLGATLRVHAMGNFEYDPALLEMQPGWTSPPAAEVVFDPSLDVAAQGQFFIRRDL
ncbi:MAG: hypothetical protein KA297_23230 [Kofleriaceae bacterium]|jgi:hypothetical protein|nr:hypothetical protein [Kofleriaceae bacterium]MBP6839155.1 hypothetical protein [Kofleriaceae bacterium]